MKRLIIILFVIAIAWSGKALETDVIPPKPDPPRLVNDFAGILTPEQIQEKEDMLVAFNDSTSNVICVVTVTDLGDYTAADFAYEIGERWGVRSTDDKRNGVVLLLKQRNETAGAVYIAVVTVTITRPSIPHWPIFFPWQLVKLKRCVMTLNLMGILFWVLLY